MYGHPDAVLDVSVQMATHFFVNFDTFKCLYMLWFDFLFWFNFFLNQFKIFQTGLKFFKPDINFQTSLFFFFVNYL